MKHLKMWKKTKQVFVQTSENLEDCVHLDSEGGQQSEIFLSSGLRIKLYCAQIPDRHFSVALPSTTSHKDGLTHFDVINKGM